MVLITFPREAKNQQKKKTATKKINFAQSDFITVTEEEYENQKKQSQITLSTYEAYKKCLFESGTLL